jgi:hypothetical protein
MIVRWADMVAIAVMLVGGALMFQPWWRGGLGVGFWILLTGTLLHIVTSHLPRRR